MANIDATQKKQCSRCWTEKPMAEFIGSKDRETVFCKTCRTVPLAERATADSLKKCPDCQQVKTLSQFSGQHRGKRGWNFYWTRCRDCNTIYQRERIRSKIRNGTAREEYKKDYLKKRWRKLLKQYGITKKQYEDMEAAQRNFCAICGRKESRTYKDVQCRLVVDHNHKTGKVRGLLCGNCNIAIGNFDEDVESIRKAIKYLELHRER